MTPEEFKALGLPKPPKPLQWCSEQGIPHQYDDSGRYVTTLLRHGLIRECMVCGHRQKLVPEHWENLDDQG